MDDRQDRLDKERASRLLEDAAFVEYPLHILINGLKFWLGIIAIILFFIVAPIVCVFYTPYAKGEANKQLRQWRYIARLDYRRTSTKQVGDSSRPSVDGMFPLKAIFLPFGPERLEGDDGFSSNPLEFCNADKRSFGNFVTTTRVPPKWSAKINFIFDPLYWEEGKSAPMFAAYATAAYSMTAMRRNLAAIKRTGRAYVQTCRDVDEFRSYAEEITPDEAAIHITDVPVVRLAYVHGGSAAGEWCDRYYGSPQFLITGMCLEGECAPEDFEYDNPFISHDLFGPTYTPHQKNAMAALRKVTTDEFWLAVAHANGIHDDAEVRAASARNRSDLAGLFPESIN
jgi:hypothetical protein